MEIKYKKYFCKLGICFRMIVNAIYIFVNKMMDDETSKNTFSFKFFVKFIRHL